MKNRYVNYFSVRNTVNGRHFTVNVWDDLLKQATFFSDIVFTKDEMKQW